MPNPGGIYANVAAFQALWTTAKSQLATLTTDYNALQTDHRNLESTIASMAALSGDPNVTGGNDVIEWLRKQVKQLPVGYKAVGGLAPYLVAGMTIYANDPTQPRQIELVDQRPISSTATGAALNLT
jgi:hypothetical protein